MNLHNRRGFSLAELGIALVILLIISTIALISYFAFIDNAKLTKMKEDSTSISEAVGIYYGKNGILPLGEAVELSEETKEIISKSTEGFCSNNVRGSVVVTGGNEILDNDGLLHSGMYSAKVDGVYDEMDIAAYKVSDKLTGEYFQDKNVKDFENYLVVDCDESSIVSEDEVLEPVVQLSCTEAQAEGYTCIETIEDLKSITSGGKYILMNDLDLSNEINWEPLGSSVDPIKSIELDGNGYSISNLSYNSNADHVGLFGYLEGNNSFKNMNLEGFNISGNSEVGILVGSVAGSVHLKNSYFNGYVVGDMSGVIGYLETLSGDNILSEIIVDINAGSDYNFYVGGLIGYSDFYGNTTFENISIDGTLASSDGTGFLNAALYQNTGNLTINNIYINGTINGTESTSDSSHGAVSGEFYIDSGTNYSIRDIDIDVDVNGNNSNIGIFSGDTWLLGKGEIFNIDIKGSVNSNSDFIGGFAGEIGIGDDINTSNITINVDKISGRDNIGGFAGGIYIDRYSNFDDINVNISNIDINIPNGINSNSSSLGGFSGYLEVNGNTNISNVNINTDVTGSKEVGMLAGYLYSGFGTVFDNVKLNGNLSGTDKVGSLFGVVGVNDYGGYSEGSADFTLKNSNINISEVVRLSGISDNFGKFVGFYKDNIKGVEVFENNIIFDTLFKGTPDTEGTVVFPNN